MAVCRATIPGARRVKSGQAIDRKNHIGPTTGPFCTGLGVSTRRPPPSWKQYRLRRACDCRHGSTEHTQKEASRRSFVRRRLTVVERVVWCVPVRVTHMECRDRSIEALSGARSAAFSHQSLSWTWTFYALSVNPNLQKAMGESRIDRSIDRPGAAVSFRMSVSTIQIEVVGGGERRSGALVETVAGSFCTRRPNVLAFRPFPFLPPACRAL